MSDFFYSPQPEDFAKTEDLAAEIVAAARAWAFDHPGFGPTCVASCGCDACCRLHQLVDFYDARTGYTESRRGTE